jgi:hypothetical protein
VTVNCWWDSTASLFVAVARQVTIGGRIMPFVPRGQLFLDHRFLHKLSKQLAPNDVIGNLRIQRNLTYCTGRLQLFSWGHENSCRLHCTEEPGGDPGDETLVGF